MANEQGALGHKRRGEAVEARDMDGRGRAEARNGLLLLSAFFPVGAMLGLRLRLRLNTVPDGGGGTSGGRRARSVTARTGTERDERGVGVFVGRVTGEAFVDDEAALAGDEGGIDDIDLVGGGGDRGGEALDEGGVEGFGVGQGGDLALVDEVEGGAQLGLARARVVLRVEGAHLLDELDERLELFVLFGQDEGRVDGAARELAAQDGEDLFADVDADVLLRFDGRGAEVRGRDDFGVGD